MAQLSFKTNQGITPKRYSVDVQFALAVNAPEWESIQYLKRDLRTIFYLLRLNANSILEIRQSQETKERVNR